jgi:hypothetical protein
MDSKVGIALKAIPTDGCYRRARGERLLGEISEKQLTHLGLAGFPTDSRLHPDSYRCDAA